MWGTLGCPGDYWHLEVQVPGCSMSFTIQNNPVRQMTVLPKSPAVPTPGDTEQRITSTTLPTLGH